MNCNCEFCETAGTQFSEAMHRHFREIPESWEAWKRQFVRPGIKSPLELKPQEPIPEPIPCCHLGAVLRTEECPTCKGTVDIEVFACAVHGECTQKQTALGKKCCRFANGKRCRDYSPP